MQKYINSVADKNGKPVSGASVLVQNYPSLTTATIYSDNNSTALSNPITTDANGAFSFYAKDGRYALQITGASITTQTVSDILLEDPADGGSAGSFSSLTVSGSATVGGSAVQTAATLSSSTAAATIGTTAGNVQTDINARPTSANLAATTGATLVGSDDGASGSLWTTVAGFIAKIISSAGASVVGFAPDTNYAVRTIGWAVTQDVYVDSFTGADDTAKLANAAAFAALLPLGGTLCLPRRQMTVTAVPALAANVNWRGQGRLASQILYTGTGNALQYNGTINTYTPLRISLRDFSILSNNAGNTGGGIVLESCSYVSIHNVYVEKFKYGHILDGCTDINCTYSELAQQARASVWIVNGADRRASQNQFWTNNIWYSQDIQLNCASTAGIYLIQDDGGVNHDFRGVNFNGGDICARFCGVRGLMLHNNAAESSAQTPFVFDDTSRELGTYVGPCQGLDARSNALSSGVPFEMLFNALDGGVVEANQFASMTSAAMTFGASSKVKGLRIAANTKLVRGSARSAKPFFDGTLPTNGRVDATAQPACTYVALALGATGAQTVTPASMERITAGTQLSVQNEDGTNSETVLVTAVSSTTFTATFASTKAANWTITGQASRVTNGTFTPTIAGDSTAGVQTYSVQQGFWQMRADGGVHVQFYVSTTAKDAATAGGLYVGGLPFGAVNTSNRYASANIALYSGFTFPAGYTQLAAVIAPNDTKIGLRRSGSGQSGTPVLAAEMGASITLVGDVIFYPS